MAAVIHFVVIIALACFEDLRRRTPYNFILLGVFTLAQSFLLGTATSHYQINEVTSSYIKETSMAPYPSSDLITSNRKVWVLKTIQLRSYCQITERF